MTTDIRCVALFPQGEALTAQEMQSLVPTAFGAVEDSVSAKIRWIAPIARWVSYRFSTGRYPFGMYTLLMVYYLPFLNASDYHILSEKSKE